MHTHIFNDLEGIRIAIEMERRGRDFYGVVAKMAQNAPMKALLEARPQGLVLVPAVAFNASKLTLDDKSLEEMAAASGCTLKASASVIDSLLEEL